MSTSFLPLPPEQSLRLPPDVRALPPDVRAWLPEATWRTTSAIW